MRSYLKKKPPFLVIRQFADKCQQLLQNFQIML